MAPTGIAYIALQPTANDKFPLRKENIVKSEFQELFNFTAFQPKEQNGAVVSPYHDNYGYGEDTGDEWGKLNPNDQHLDPKEKGDEDPKEKSDEDGDSDSESNGERSDEQDRLHKSLGEHILVIPGKSTLLCVSILVLDLMSKKISRSPSFNPTITWR